MKPNTPNTSIFSMAFGLEYPWYVEEVKLLDNNESPTKELYLYLNFRRGHEFVLSDGRSGRCYDTIDKVWQHLHFFQHRCFLHCRVPRIKVSDGSVVLGLFLGLALAVVLLFYLRHFV